GDHLRNAAKAVGSGLAREAAPGKRMQPAAQAARQATRPPRRARLPLGSVLPLVASVRHRPYPRRALLAQRGFSRKHANAARAAAAGGGGWGLCRRRQVPFFYPPGGLGGTGWPCASVALLRRSKAVA